MTTTPTCPVDLVVFSAGIRPRDDLARGAGLAVGERGGIVVDRGLEPPRSPGVYAIGECALVDGRIYGLVAPGYDMARALVPRLTGTPATRSLDPVHRRRPQHQAEAAGSRRGQLR